MIREGEVVAFPTETFYGLGADAFNVRALQKVFRIKRREKNKPLLLLVADRTWLSALVKGIPPVAEHLMERFWPGPLTLVFEASPHLPDVLTAKTGKVGVRVSAHPVASALVEAVDGPITGTSANLSGQVSPSTAAEVLAALRERLGAVLDGGKTRGGLGSTVLDVSNATPRIIRQGAIPREDLEPFLVGSPRKGKD